MKKFQSNGESSSSEVQLFEARRTRGTDCYKFWNELKATGVDSNVCDLESTPASSRDSTPSSDGISSIDLTEPAPPCHRPSRIGIQGYHGDSPCPPHGLPSIHGVKMINDDKWLTRAEARGSNPLGSSKNDIGFYDPHPPLFDKPSKPSYQRHYVPAQRNRDAPPPNSDNESPQRHTSRLRPGLPSANNQDGSSGKRLISCETKPSKPGGLLYTNADLLHCKNSDKLSRYNVNVPISRELIQQIEEPSRWKKQRAEKVQNAIDRVERNYVTNPRSYHELDINKRIDEEFVPQSPPDPRPSLQSRQRKNNRVIVEPDKMARARGCMLGDSVPGQMPAHVQHSPSHPAGPHKPNLHRSQAYHQAMLQEQRLMEASDASGPLDRDIRQHNMPGQQNLKPLGLTYEAYPPANSPRFQDASYEWRKERELTKLRASQRVQQQYVNGLREEADLREPKPKTGWDLEQEIRATYAKSERKGSLSYWDRDAGLTEDPQHHNGSNNISGRPEIHHIKQHPGYDKPQTDYGLARSEYGVARYGGIAVKENKIADREDPLRKTTPVKIRIDATKNAVNATMSTKGVGFKSRLKKQQEEAALRNIGNDDIGPHLRDNRRIHAPILRGTGSTSHDAMPIIRNTGSTNNKPTQAPKHLSSEARKYWKHKTIG